MLAQGDGAIIFTPAATGVVGLPATDPCCCGDSSPPDTWTWSYARRCSDGVLTNLWRPCCPSINLTYYRFADGICYYFTNEPGDVFQTLVNEYPTAADGEDFGNSTAFQTWTSTGCDDAICHGGPPPPLPPAEPPTGCGCGSDHFVDDDFCHCIGYKIRATVSATTNCVCFICGDVEPSYNTFSSGFGPNGIYDMIYQGLIGGKHTWLSDPVSIDIDRGSTGDGGCVNLNQAGTWFAVLQKTNDQWWSFALFSSDVGYITGDPIDLDPDNFQYFAFRGTGRGDHKGCLGVPSMTNLNTLCQCFTTVSGGFNVGHPYIATGGTVHFEGCSGGLAVFP